jgi:TRAP-type C4-dicarboxylate transport system permease small subunit
LKGKSAPGDVPASGWDVALVALDRVTLVFNLVGTVLILGLMVLIGADILGRQAFNAPIPGVPELVSLSIVAIVFLQVPQALRAGRFTRSDSLLNLLKNRHPRLGESVEIMFDLVAIATLLALIYSAWPLFVKDWQNNTFVGAVGDFTAPVWPVKLALVLGTALLILQFCARIVRRLRRKQSNDGISDVGARGWYGSTDPFAGRSGRPQSEHSHDGERR